MKKEKIKEFLLSSAGKAVVILLVAILIFGIMMLAVDNDWGFIAWPMVIACGYFGWRALNMITPDVFVIGTMGFWFLYYVIKGILSVLIGVFVAPFQISKMICNAIYNSEK